MSLPISATGAVQAPTSATGAATGPQTGKAKTESAKEAKAFEQMLVGQLTKVLVDSAMPEDATSAATSAYRDMLPDALTEALMSGGGIGLAKTLEEASK